MSKLDLTEQHARQRAGFAAPVPISISTAPATMRITACCTSSDLESLTRSSQMRSCLTAIDEIDSNKKICCNANVTFWRWSQRVDATTIKDLALYRPDHMSDLGHNPEHVP